MQPPCQISKKLYGKSKPCNHLSTALRDPTSQKDIRHIVQSTEVRNNIINIHLPFDDLHQNALPGIPVPQKMFVLFDNVDYVQIATFVSVFCKQIQTHEAHSLGADNVKKFRYSL